MDCRDEYQFCAPFWYLNNFVSRLFKLYKVTGKSKGNKVQKRFEALRKKVTNTKNLTRLKSSRNDVGKNHAGTQRSEGGKVHGGN